MAKTLMLQFSWIQYMRWMSNFAWWYYLLSFTCSYHIHWVWLYLKLTAVSIFFTENCMFLSKFKLHKIVKYVKMIMNISLFWRSLVFKGDKTGIWSFWKEKKKNVYFFPDTITARFFKLRMIITLFGIYIVFLGLMTLTLFQGHRRVRNINCKLHVWDLRPL